MQFFAKVLAINVAAMCLSCGSFAQVHQHRYHEPLPPNPPPWWIAEGRPLQEWEWRRFDYSGTRGRMGLGASPFHPEGPGNFSFPGR